LKKGGQIVLVRFCSSDSAYLNRSETLK